MTTADAPPAARYRDACEAIAAVTRTCRRLASEREVALQKQDDGRALTADTHLNDALLTLARLMRVRDDALDEMRGPSCPERV